MTRGWFWTRKGMMTMTMMSDVGLVSSDGLYPQCTRMLSRVAESLKVTPRAITGNTSFPPTRPSELETQSTFSTSSLVVERITYTFSLIRKFTSVCVLLAPLMPGAGLTGSQNGHGFMVFYGFGGCETSKNFSVELPMCVRYAVASCTFSTKK